MRPCYLCIGAYLILKVSSIDCIGTNRKTHSQSSAIEGLALHKSRELEYSPTPPPPRVYPRKRLKDNPDMQENISREKKKSVGSVSSVSTERHVKANFKNDKLIFLMDRLTWYFQVNGQHAW